MEALIFVAIALLVGLVVWLSWHLKKKRREEMARMARQLGLDYSPQDTRGCLSLPFALLARGDGRGTENLLWGTWQGMAVQEFDYWYYEESRDSEGHRTRSYYRFSCAVASIDAVCSPLSLGRENLFTRVADGVGLRDIEFESEQFNRAFNVKCKDRKFANDLIDARMMQWLLSIEGAYSFEVSGGWILCFTKRRRPTELIPLLGTLQQFHQQVPRVVYDLYGSDAAR
jgi:hypothetical protein